MNFNHFENSKKVVEKFRVKKIRNFLRLRIYIIY